MTKVYVPPPHMTYFMERFANWLAEEGTYKVTITLESDYESHSVAVDKRSQKPKAGEA